MTKCTEEGVFDIIIHVKDEYDYKLVCKKRNELFSAIKAAYFNTMNRNLPIYAVPV